MTRRKRGGLEMGYDSFLDIVANLVGILIILVVVLGAQSQEAADEAAAATLAASEEMLQYQKATALSHAARLAVNDLQQESKMYDIEIASRRKERDVLLDMLTLAKEQWQEEKTTLSQSQQQAIALTSELTQKKKQLSELMGDKERLENSEAQVTVLEHLPSPMAKTVFGEEIHLRLKEGRVSVVPIEGLVAEIRRIFERAVDGTAPGISTAKVGPVRGYMAEYRVQRSRATVTRGGSIGTAVRMELTGLVIEPVQENFGEPISTVLTDPRSILEIELAGRPAETTTVTVWVYPDSFQEFRQLKEFLYAKGIATAARPLPEGRPISGGPDGSRSSAQ